jgi:excisionase family DNA binding protein
MMPPKGFYTIEEAAQELNVSVSEIENLMRSGKMREQVVGKKRLVPAYSVQAVLRHRDQASSTARKKTKVQDYSESNESHQREDEEVRKNKGSEQELQQATSRTFLSRNDRDSYCPIDDAAKNLNKSIGQIRQLILEEKLSSAVFSGERMVLIHDVERLANRGPSAEPWRRGLSPRAKAQNQESKVPQKHELNRDDYCTLTNAAQRLNKSINQIKGLIDTGKLRSELLGAQRMVLREDVDLMSQDAQYETREKGPRLTGTVEYSKWPAGAAENESEDEEAKEAASRVKGLEEELESVQNQLASERALWRVQSEQERKERQQLNSEAQEKISSIRKEAYAIQEDLEQERDKRKKVDEDAQIEIDTLDKEVKALKDELEQERADRLGAQWEVQELKVELEDGRANIDLGDESSQSPNSQAEEQLEVLQSELEEERQLREKSEDWVKNLQSERESLHSKLEEEQSRRKSLGEQAREFEKEKNLLDQVRLILGDQPASEISDTPATAEETDDEAQEYVLDTPDGQHTFSSPFPLEDGDLELLQLIARSRELTAEQIRKQTGRRRAKGDLDGLLDKLHEQGISVIEEVSEDRYRLDVTKLQSD